VTDIGLVCVVEHCALTELKEVLLLLALRLGKAAEIGPNDFRDIMFYIFEMAIGHHVEYLKA